MGSVKDLEIVSPVQDEKLGIGKFNFSNRYSVFDWGEMPDLIDGKGESLCITSAFFFEKLESAGIKTHYRGVVEDGRTKRLCDLKKPQSSFEINMVRVLRPKVVNNKYDYSIFEGERNNFLIPLEVIYRNSLPEGSSVFKRIERGDLTLEAIGLSKMPLPGIKLDRPIFDVSTKLETSDRYMGWDEAGEISGLSPAELLNLLNGVAIINTQITEAVAQAHLVNEDGKVEFGFNEKRELILLDTVGTLDECRFTYNNLPVSKEILRRFYRNTPWHKAIEEAKKLGKREWKKGVKLSPAPLPQKMKKLISLLYKSACNEITDRKWFGDAPALKTVLEALSL